MIPGLISLNCVQGGFGKVYDVLKVRGAHAGQRYAMKEISKRTVLDRNHVAMVLNERCLLERCVLACGYNVSNTSMRRRCPYSMHASSLASVTARRR